MTQPQRTARQPKPTTDPPMMLYLVDGAPPFIRECVPDYRQYDAFVVANREWVEAVAASKSMSLEFLLTRIDPSGYANIVTIRWFDRIDANCYCLKYLGK